MCAWYTKLSVKLVPSAKSARWFLCRTKIFPGLSHKVRLVAEEIQTSLREERTRGQSVSTNPKKLLVFKQQCLLPSLQKKLHLWNSENTIVQTFKLKCCLLQNFIFFLSQNISIFLKACTQISKPLENLHTAAPTARFKWCHLEVNLPRNNVWRKFIHSSFLLYTVYHKKLLTVQAQL